MIQVQDFNDLVINKALHISKALACLFALPSTGSRIREVS